MNKPFQFTKTHNLDTHTDISPTKDKYCLVIYLLLKMSVFDIIIRSIYFTSIYISK